MNLTSIEIDNYRSCEHTVLECGSNLTALIGLNAAGKSNILSAIYILGLLGNFQDTRFHADNDGNLHVYLEHDSWKAEVFTNLRKRAEPEMAFLFGDLLNEQIRLPLYFFSKNSDEQFVKARKAFLSELLGNNKDAAFYTTLFTRLDTIQDFFANIRYYPSSFYNDASNMDILVTTDQPNTPSEWFIYNLYVCQFKEKGLYQRYKDLICKNGMNLVDDIIVTLGSPGNNNPHASSLPQATEALNGKYITPLAMTNGKTLLFSQLSAGTYRIMALLFYLIRN
ncbi:MAG: ATP-binding protein, partial [Spirochaetaceae bacterium]|nr:ATP-binding protein [Spirochaetaceae bacterium]